MACEELGVISGIESSISIARGLRESAPHYFIMSHVKAIKVLPATDKKVSIPVYPLTMLGKELANIPVDYSD
jgi:hypothetical protein